MCWHTECKSPVFIWLQALLDVGAKIRYQAQSPSLHHLAVLFSASVSSSSEPCQLLVRWLPEVLGLYLILSTILSKKEFLFPNNFFFKNWLRFSQHDPYSILSQQWKTLNARISIISPVLQPEGHFNFMKPQVHGSGGEEVLKEHCNASTRSRRYRMLDGQK